MDTIDYKWMDLPEDVAVILCAVKETNDTIMSFFIEDKIEKSNNPKLKESFGEFYNLMLSSLSMFVSLEKHCNQIFITIDKLNQNAENQVENPEIATLIFDVIQDLNLTVLNFYVIFSNPAFSYVPSLDKTDAELIIELHEARDALVPYVEKLFEQAVNFDKYFEEMSYLCERFFKEKSSL